jgi:peptidoglycan/xylan/chitin deacetylase (PgdA/CDA1 family)
VSKRLPVRKLYSTLIARSGLAALQRRRLRQSVAIVTYHAIDAAQFAAHLAFLARAYRIVSLDSALAGLRGETSLPANPLVITFDDGFGSLYTEVYPALQRFNAPATVFLTTGYAGAADILWFSWIDLAFDHHVPMDDILPPALQGVERRLLSRFVMRHLKSAPDDERLRFVKQIKERTVVAPGEMQQYRLLTWDQAREMEKSGLLTFGGHTQTHPILARAAADKAEREIAGCSADLLRELGPKPRPFAYPNGETADFSDAIKAMVRESGFTCATSASRGLCLPGDDLYALRRVAVDPTFSTADVAAKLSGLWVHLGPGGW